MCCADDERLNSTLYVADVKAMATALDLVGFMEARNPGNKLLACRLFPKKGQQPYALQVGLYPRPHLHQ